MNRPRAIIYTRVSYDKSGRSTSTQQQERACRSVCDVEGWPVADVIEDADLGASRRSTKARPGFQRLQQILGRGDVLVMWEGSRGTRRLGEYAEFRDLCAERGVMWHIGGRLYDLDDPGDRLTLGIGASVSEYEADQMHGRIMRGIQAHADAGKPWGSLPYGYRRVRDEDSGRTVNWRIESTEAALLREAVERVLHGESVYTVAREFNERGIAPPRGARTGWAGSPLREMLVRPVYAGIRRYGGVDIEGTWPALWDLETHDRLVGALATKDPIIRPGRVPASLLSAIAVCGVCGGPMEFRTGKPEIGRRARYECRRSCLGRRADKVDDMVREAVVMFFTSAPGEKLLARQHDTSGAHKALEEARQLQARLDEAQDAYADGDIELSALQRVTARLRPRIEEAKHRAEQASANPVLEHFRDADPREVWEQLTVLERRAVVADCLRVTILRMPFPSKKFEPDFVKITVRGEVPVDSLFFTDDRD
ncbi:hypothetical protein A5N74_01615 [Prescottella equi]|nr:hypothetical protein A5N69_07080 [Prescottella equi]ORM21561.1 hypothetical protein A5N74_01615 [Prescottella equi]